jgi:O-antigen ligase
MKWMALTGLLAATLPLSAWLRRNPWVASKVLMLIGFLPFAIYAFHLYMAVISWQEWSGYVRGVPISWTEWPGYVKGAEVSVLDLLALAYYLSLRGAWRRPPFCLSMGLYFVAASLSVLWAAEPLAALFYIWQLARMFLIYAVVTRACAEPRGASSLLKGMAAGLFMEAGVEIWQRFGLGVIQTSGTLIHQNLLGMMSHFVVFPFAALLLAGVPGWLPAAVTVAGIPVELLTASRGTVGVAVLGYAMVFILSALRHWTPRKGVFLFAGIIASLAFLPLALQSFDSRFAAQSENSYIDPSYHERAAFEQAAAMMLADHPWGVGVNQYVLVANNEEYNERAGVAPFQSSLLSNVHNVYYLVAAESGYLGIITFLILLLRPMLVALLCGWQNRSDPRGDLLIGLGVALLTVYIHSNWEWIFVDFEVQYLFVFTLGMVAALAEQLGYFERTGSLGFWHRAATLPINPMKKAREISRRGFG